MGLPQEARTKHSGLTARELAKDQFDCRLVAQIIEGGCEDDLIHPMHRFHSGITSVVHVEIRTVGNGHDESSLLPFSLPPVEDTIRIHTTAEDRNLLFV